MPPDNTTSTHITGRLIVGPDAALISVDTEDAIAFVTAPAMDPNDYVNPSAIFQAREDANARRMAACWNIAESIPTELLEVLVMAQVDGWTNIKITMPAHEYDRWSEAFVKAIQDDRLLSILASHIAVRLFHGGCK